MKIGAFCSRIFDQILNAGEDLFGSSVVLAVAVASVLEHLSEAEEPENREHPDSAAAREKLFHYCPLKSGARAGACPTGSATSPRPACNRVSTSSGASRPKQHHLLTEYPGVLERIEHAREKNC